MDRFAALVTSILLILQKCDGNMVQMMNERRKYRPHTLEWRTNHFLILIQGVFWVSGAGCGAWASSSSSPWWCREPPAGAETQTARRWQLYAEFGDFYHLLTLLTPSNTFNTPCSDLMTLRWHLRVLEAHSGVQLTQGNQQQQWPVAYLPKSYTSQSERKF